jgi:hypothetical protein
MRIHNTLVDVQAYSLDGVHWTFAGYNTYSYTMNLTNGSSYSFYRREVSIECRKSIPVRRSLTYIVGAEAIIQPKDWTATGSIQRRRPELPVQRNAHHRAGTGLQLAATGATGADYS